MQHQLPTVELIHRRLVYRLILLVVAMFGFGFMLVPLYDVICDITGLNGKTGRATAEQVTQGPDLGREITVKFVASINEVAPWIFSPNDKELKVHPGGVYTTSYYAENKTNRMLVGQAAPSVSPREASLYFKKMECFCFTRQPFEPNEGRDMPVQFVIDRDIPSHVNTVILSYTFFDITQQG